MAVSKILFGDTPIIDLTKIDCTESDVMRGYTFHKADGTIGIGTKETQDVTVNVPNIIIPGMAYTVPSWSAGTDEDIAEALDLHYAGLIDLTKSWSVGDERIVSLSAMDATEVGESHVSQNVALVLSELGGKTLATPINGHTTCAFQVDQRHCLKEKGYMNSLDTNIGGWGASARRTWCNSVYKNAVPSSLRGIFKEFINQTGIGGGSSGGIENTTDIFALRSEEEVFRFPTYSVPNEGLWVSWYKTSSNRIKQVNGVNSAWWGRSAMSNDDEHFCYITNVGVKNHTNASNAMGLAPFGVI